MAKGSLDRGEYTRSYSDIRGIELGGSGSRISDTRLAYAENVYRDYDGDGGGLIESVPGYREIANLGAPIRKLAQYKDRDADYLIATANRQLYRIPKEARDSNLTYSTIGTLRWDDGASFNFLGSHYITDKSTIVRIRGEGVAEELADDGMDVYIPTTYRNKERFEQRNLLTNRIKEQYVLVDPKHYTYGTPVLNYVILDNELGTCMVSGVSDVNYPGAWYIPSVTMINGREFRVIEIGPYALASCVYMTELYIAEGIEKIGKLAIRHCIRLERAVLPRSLTETDVGVFSECTALRKLYIGSGLKVMGANITAGCPLLSTVYFGGNQDTFATITGRETIEDKNITYNIEDRRVALRLPLSTACTAVTGVKEHGIDIPYTTITEGERVVAVIGISESAWDTPTDCVIEAVAEEVRASFGYSGEALCGIEAVAGCTVAEAFDDRIFLSGNSRLPNTVFYSSPSTNANDTALYFGELNYFTDGVGAYGVVDMLAVRDALAVFKSGDDGTGSIYYHTPEATGDDFMPKIYPRAYVHSGISAIGGATSFFDDPVFLTKSGLYALTQKAINYERSVAPRSENVNYSLLNKDISRASVTEWCGYLVVGVGSSVYLADSRARYTDECGNMQYEWFYLSGIGHYEGDRRVYRFDSYTCGEYIAHKDEGAVADGEVFSVTAEDGTIIYYIEDGGKKYTVYPTDELTGGVFSEATVYLGCDNLLFFGTEDGRLLVFNNDKRGVAPDYIKECEDFDPEEYRLEMGQRLHPYFYSFDRHAPTYVIRTAYDNCGIPHLTKSTSKHSLVLKYRTYSAADIRCEVGTDVGSYVEVTSFPGGELSFRDIDFENFAMALGDYHTVPISEKEKGWVEKQITILSDRYNSPIGIYQITYRYIVKGRIKRQ